MQRKTHKQHQERLKCCCWRKQRPPASNLTVRYANQEDTNQTAMLMTVEPTKVIRDTIRDDCDKQDSVKTRVDSVWNLTYNHTRIQNKFAASEVRIGPSDPVWTTFMVSTKRFGFYGPRKAENAKHSKTIKLGQFKNLSVNWCEKFIWKGWEKSTLLCGWKDLKAAGYSLAVVEVRKRMCNLSSYLCIWRSALPSCHDLFYSDEAWCQNLCLAAKTAC